MREATLDLWAPCTEPTIVCITTNGSVKRNGKAVMGAGCALEAVQRWPELDLPKLQAESLVYFGLHCYPLRNGLDIGGTHRIDLWVYPTKIDWRQSGQLWLIEQSARELADMWGGQPTVTVRLPRPGCGYGGLKWEDVRSVIAPILPDNVVVVSR